MSKLYTHHAAITRVDDMFKQQVKGAINKATLMHDYNACRQDSRWRSGVTADFPDKAEVGHVRYHFYGANSSKWST